MTWFLDQRPAPRRIQNPECPVTVVPRDDGSFGLRIGSDSEIYGTFPSASSAFTYATARYSHVNPLLIEPAAPAVLPHATKSVRGVLGQIS